MLFRPRTGKTGHMSTELDLGWFDPNLGALQRREASGLSTGLSRAIAERLGVDVILVRVVFVVLTFCAGLGLALYGWGTVLTRGPQGVRPVDQFLPGFRGWSPFSQKTLVVVSTIAFIATIGSAFPLPWGAGLLVLIALAVLRRRTHRAAAQRGWQYPPPHPSALSPQPGTLPPSQPAPLDDQMLVEQWRRSLTEAVGTHRAAVPTTHALPEVDLYSAEDEGPLPRTLAPQAKAGWLGGLAVVAAMALTAFLTGELFSLGGTVALAATTAVGGLGAVVFALVARRRRIPRLVLAAVAASVVTTGWLAAQTPSMPLDTPGTHTVRVVAAEAVVDLREIDLTGINTVQVDAVLADVEVILPGPIAASTVRTWAAEVTDLTGPAGPDAEVLEVELDISAKLANVTIREQP